MLALGQNRNRVQLHDAATFQRLATLEMPGPASLTGVSLSPDGTRLALTTEYNILVLWNLRRLREELAARDLDWEMPPFPTGEQHAGFSETLTVKVLSASTSPH